MTTTKSAAVTGGVQLVDTPGRQARPDRPVRFADPDRNAAYWARIDAVVDQAPPLSMEQKAIIRAAFHSAQAQEAA